MNGYHHDHNQPRGLPNILVTGTPGTGKTTFCEMLGLVTDLKHIDISGYIKERQLHAGYDREFDCYYLDEDRLCDELESSMKQGGMIIDFHTCDFFPERWFDLVMVLRTNNRILYDRLMKR
jgi:adenylate kinase